jgi:hypothetical protein
LHKAVRYIQAYGLLSYYADPDPAFSQIVFILCQSGSSIFPSKFDPDHDSEAEKKMDVLLMRGKIKKSYLKMIKSTFF